MAPHEPQPPPPRGPGFGGAGFEFVRQLVLIVTAVLLYFGVRGLTQGDVSDAVKTGLDILKFEAKLGLDFEHWAQGLIVDNHALVTFSNWVYIWGHWPVISAVLLWTYITNRPAFLTLRNAMFISGAIGLVIFMSYPVAPPRLLEVGLMDTVSEFSNSYRILQPPSLVNQYAAVPSLHVGWNLLIGITIFTSTRRIWLRIIGVIIPILMAISVIVTANHFVIDGILGAIVALVGLWASKRFTPQLVELDDRFRNWVAVKRGQTPGPTEECGDEELVDADR
jgi:hypothetical protein